MRGNCASPTIVGITKSIDVTCAECIRLIQQGMARHINDRFALTATARKLNILEEKWRTRMKTHPGAVFHPQNSTCIHDFAELLAVFRS